MSQTPEPKPPSCEPEEGDLPAPAPEVPAGSLPEEEGAFSEEDGPVPAESPGSPEPPVAPELAQEDPAVPARGGAQPAAVSSTPMASTPPSREVSPNVYQVVLPTFEGPLDLLLHLIQQHELDILDIPIAFISEKYVEYIMLMQGMNIDLASEYLVMAATLAHIKSKMLLPTPPVDQEEEAENEADPRAELVRRLLEYQKYRLAAEELGNSPVLGRDVFSRGASAPSVDGPAPLAAVSVFKLLDAFQSVLKRVQQTAEHHIDVDRISISDRINQLTDMLRGRERVPFESLFEEGMTRSDLVVTFLALLEMTRLRMTRIFQDGPLDPIFVELSLTDDDSPGDDTADLSDG